MVGAVTTMRRRLIALAAAYAIALQAVVAGFAVLAAAGVAMPGLCTSSVPREQPGRDAGHGLACVACPAHCGEGGPAGALPAAVEAPVSHTASERGVRGLPQLAVQATPRERPPSRAPPAA
jgi:hypothetical protein